MKYKIDSLIVQNLTRIDILLYCYYCLNVPKKRGKIKKIKVWDVVKHLTRIDYNYVDLDMFKVRNEIRCLFPIRKNNNKRTKYYKISNTLIFYWGEKFNINYTQHSEIYSTLKKFDDGTLLF